MPFNVTVTTCCLADLKRPLFVIRGATRYPGLSYNGDVVGSGLGLAMLRLVLWTTLPVSVLVSVRALTVLLWFVPTMTVLAPSPVTCLVPSRRRADGADGMYTVTMLVHRSMLLSDLNLITRLTFGVLMAGPWWTLTADTLMSPYRCVKRDLTLLALTTSVAPLLGSTMWLVLRYVVPGPLMVQTRRPPTTDYTTVNTRLDMSRLQVLAVPASTELWRSMLGCRHPLMLVS